VFLFGLFYRDTHSKTQTRQTERQRNEKNAMEVKESKRKQGEERNKVGA
jgi:hypothetical protein